MRIYKPVYTATATLTISPENIATSATFVAGVESNAISNVTNLYDDVLISGLWTSGTTPTASTSVQLYVVPCVTDNLAGTVTWPDVFDGTASAETVTSAGVLSGLAVFAGALSVDTNTSNRAYNMRQFPVAAQLFNMVMPTNFVLFLAHNTGANSNATTGNHAWYALGVQWQPVTT